MILFKNIEYKNFLSTGNVTNRISLNENNTTLLVGKNGHGKSTIIDALTFSLFGKPFRNISKNQLINSINGKATLVTIEFDVAGSSYKVIRGIKPNIFEIWKNGEMINQDASVRDYQTVLEQQILKMNYRAFTQIVILGAATFVPFMQLTASNRREVIEDILDIRIFSNMNIILKDKIQGTKKAIDAIDTNILLAKSTVENQKKLIDTMMASKQSHIESVQSRIDNNKQEIKLTKTKSLDIIKTINDLQQQIIDGVSIQETISCAKGMIRNIEHSNSITQKSLGFFDKNDNCPSCAQNISHDHKTSIRDILQTDYDLNLVELEELQKELERCNIRKAEIDNITAEVIEAKKIIHGHKFTILALEQQIVNLEEDIKNALKDQGNIDLERDKLKAYASEAIENINAKTLLQEQRSIEDIASVLLKDTGIKTAVIREYLPAMNTLINRYLTAMDFYVSFELDESFNESIKSRYRDNFTYASFSEGEKKRLDLAILFAWREIARLKNSANTNLLVLDEVLEGSLDINGTDYIMSLLSSLGDDINVFVISHNIDQIQDSFDKILTVEKKHDFSEIKD